MSSYQDRLLWDILLPGTHDTAGFRFEIPYPENFTDWTRTQEHSVYEQLNMGIRVFDLRVTVWNTTLYHTHYFVTTPFTSSLSDT